MDATQGEAGTEFEAIRRLYFEKHSTIREVAHELYISRRIVRDTLLQLGPLRAARLTSRSWMGPFSGEEKEKAYLLGLRAGDINAFRSSDTLITARVSTTHKAMLELFQQSFAPYGQCILEPRRVFLSGFDWQMKIELHNSFNFILEKSPSPPQEAGLLYAFLAGLSDSDGCWCLFEDKGKTACAFMVTSEDKELLARLKRALEKESFHVYLYLDRKTGTRKVLSGVGGTKVIRLTRDIWRLDIHRREEVRRMARRLLPFSRHREKVLKMCLILDERNEIWEVAAPKLEKLKATILEETHRSIRDAEIEYNTRHRTAGEGGRRLDR